MNENRPILLVDNDPTNLKLLEKVLRKNGYLKISAVSDSRRVVECYTEMKPDLILLDLNMPFFNGYEVINQLKALNDPLLPPIVVITAQDDKKSLLKALELGARDYITKPFDTRELLMRVRNLLEVQFAHRLMINEKLSLEEIVDVRTSEVVRTRLQIVRRLGIAAEYKNGESGGHILRMSSISAYLAKKLNYTEGECDLILNASTMHDVGKIGIPDKILLKPEKLNDEEWEIMKTHTTLGAKLLAGDRSELLCTASMVAESHHERWDGGGYPKGLKEHAIHPFARIVALADVYDTLTSKRRYKKAWSLEATLDYINQQRGKHFDPTIAELALNEVEEIEKLRARYPD